MFGIILVSEGRLSLFLFTVFHISGSLTLSGETEAPTLGYSACALTRALSVRLSGSFEWGGAHRVEVRFIFFCGISHLNALAMGDKENNAEIRKIREQKGPCLSTPSTACQLHLQQPN